MPEVISGLLAALADASGWLIAVVLAVTFAYGFHRGWWVPGFIYDREVARADANDKTLDIATETIAASATATEAAARANADLAKRFAALQRRISNPANDSPE